MAMLKYGHNIPPCLTNTFHYSSTSFELHDIESIENSADNDRIALTLLCMATVSNPCMTCMTPV